MIPNIVGPEYLVPILHLPVDTIKVYARSRPDSLPPRWQPPGIRKLLWLESDVLDWIQSFSAKSKEHKKRGRPVSRAYAQDLQPSDGSSVASS